MEYWRKGIIYIPLYKTKEWGLSNSIEATELVFESILQKIPYYLDIVYDNIDFSIRVTAKEWHTPKEGFFVYKYYVKDELVYIGRTDKPFKRYLEHAHEDSRFKTVTRFDLFECASKADMVLLERVLIGKYTPPWNIVDKDIGTTTFKTPNVKFDRNNLIEFAAKY
jgi:hypothetical protein